MFWLAVGWARGEADGFVFGQKIPAHPRLLLTDEALASAIVAAKDDPVRAALHARIIATAESVFDAPPARHIAAGNSSLDQARYAVHYILHCALAFRLTKDARFLERAKAELFNVANFSDWNPDHFLDVGELSFAVAVGYDWLYPHLQPAERDALKQALLVKSLALAEAAYAAKEKKGRRVEWATKNSNWNQVCNSGVLCAALALADEEPVLAERIVTGVRKSLPIGMSPFAPDGEHPEGPGYWTYGTSYNAIGLAVLEGVLGTDFGLSSAPGFDRTIDYVEAVHGPFGLPFNYADSTDDPQNSPVRAWLALRYNRPIALRKTRALLAASLANGKITPFDPTIQLQVVNRFFPLHAVWFPVETSAQGDELPLDQHFRGVADIAMFRSAWNEPTAIFVGFKAGQNALRHNHLDLGSFVLDADGVRWAEDLGPDVYELPGFFDYTGRRWDYFRVNNRSHNTVTPGDTLQKTGAIAPITSFGGTHEFGFAVADLTAAYSSEVVSLRRGVALIDRSRVLMQDEYEPIRAETPLRWRMVTRAQIELGEKARVAFLKENGRLLRVEILEPASVHFAVESARPPTAAEKQNEGAEILAIELNSETSKPQRLVVLLSPVGAHWPETKRPLIRPLNDWR